MSIKLMTDCWDNGDPELTGSRLLVLLCLADHANDDGVCWPSLARLAARTRIDRRNAIAHVHALERLGYITVTRLTGRPNRYEVRATRDASITRNTGITRDAGITPTRDAGITPTRDAGITPPVMLASPEPPVNHQFNHQFNHHKWVARAEPRRDGQTKRPTRQADSDFALVCLACEQTLGLSLTPTANDLLWDWLDYDKYPASWITEAMQVALKANKCRLDYVEGILRRWKAEGKENRRSNGSAPSAAPDGPAIAFDPAAVCAEDVL